MTLLFFLLVPSVCRCVTQIHGCLLKVLTKLIKLEAHCGLHIAVIFNRVIFLSHLSAELYIQFPFVIIDIEFDYNLFFSGNVSLHPESPLSYVFGGILAGKSYYHLALRVRAPNSCIYHGSGSLNFFPLYQMLAYMVRNTIFGIMVLMN